MTHGNSSCSTAVTMVQSVIVSRVKLQYSKASNDRHATCWLNHRDNRRNLGYNIQRYKPT